MKAYRNDLPFSIYSSQFTWNNHILQCNLHVKKVRLGLGLQVRLNRLSATAFRSHMTIQSLWQPTDHLIQSTRPPLKYGQAGRTASQLGQSAGERSKRHGGQLVSELVNLWLQAVRQSDQVPPEPPLSKHKRLSTFGLILRILVRVWQSKYLHLLLMSRKTSATAETSASSILYS